MNRTRLEIKGQKFGKLTAIECLEYKDSKDRFIWKFICECGNEVLTSASNAKLGRKISCGCAVKDHCRRITKSHIKPDLGGPKNKLYGRYKLQATKRGYDFNLTKDQFLTLIDKPCYYCGTEPNTKLSLVKIRDKRTSNNTLIYNGVDRKDNTVGYDINNCVTACFKCNKMKMEMNHDEFINHINNIIRNLGVKYE